MPKKLTFAQKKIVFSKLFKTARWALRKNYGRDEASQIMYSFRSDPVEIIVIAARDLSNAIRKENERRSLLAPTDGDRISWGSH